MYKQMKCLIGLMAMGLMLVFPVITHATPGAKVLITDNPGHRVIEVDPTMGSVVWQYGITGVPGSMPGHLNYPNEAIPLTNGNIMIADTYNGRIIEVDSATKDIVWQYPREYTTPFTPVDIKRCKDYSQGTRDTLLITDISHGSRVVEITYPAGVTVWNFNASSIGGTGDYIFWEAEKRPGLGTPTYLITCRSNTAKDSIIEVERTGQNTGIVTWQYGGNPQNPLLNDPRDANWTPCGNVLITDPDSKRVIEVQPTPPSGGTIVWQYGPYAGYIPLEAIRIENMDTLIAGVAPPNPTTWDDNKDGKYPPQGGGYNYTDIREINGTSTIVWSYMQWGTGTPYGTGTESAFVDVEEKGIINIAKIEYRDMFKKSTKLLSFAGVVVPIFQPEIVWVGTPTIVATKTVSPKGPQQPGATLTYTIQLANTGLGTATNVVVTDRIPDGTVYLPGTTWSSGFSGVTTLWSHDGGLTYDNSQILPVTHIRWTIPEMPAGESGSVGFSVRIE